MDPEVRAWDGSRMAGTEWSPPFDLVRDVIWRDRFPSKGSCSHATNLIVIDAC